jgi:HEAT repeats
VAGVATLLFSPSGNLIFAFLRGEAFYHGTPSSSWSKIIREGSVPYIPPGCVVAWDIHKYAPASTSDKVKRFFGLKHAVSVDYYPLRNDDADAIPVLIELLQDDDSLVRMYSAETLGSFGARAKAAIPALKKVTNDKAIGAFAISVGERAVEAITRIESDIQVSPLVPSRR